MFKYVDCDIFDMNVDIIGHQVNLYGIMGGGIAREIKERFPDVYEEYREICLSESGLLGKMHLTYAYVDEDGESELMIANLFGQDESAGQKVLTNYSALASSLKFLHEWASMLDKKTIALPYGLGCGIAGGDWNIVSKLIEDEFGTDEELVCYICRLV